MSTTFDIQPVLFVCCALNVVLGICMVLVQRTRQTYPGFVHWMIACLGIALAMLSLALPQFFSIPALTIWVNILLVQYPILYSRGLRAFAGQSYNWVPAIVGIFLCVILAYYFTVFDLNTSRRVTAITLVQIPFYVDCMWFAWRNPTLRYAVARPWLAGAFFALTVWSLIRIALVLVLLPNERQLLAPTIVQLAAMVMVSAMNIVVTIGAIVLNFQRVAAELQVRERRLSLAMSATLDAIWEWNLETGEIYHSPRWYEILGLPYDSNLRMTPAVWRSLCHPEDAEMSLARFTAATNTTDASGYSVEFRMRHADGSWRWIQGRGRVVARNAEGRAQVMSGTNTDITDMVQARERQTRLEEQLQQSNKMQALGTLAGGVAHDFNNILVGIQGNVQLAEMDLPANSPVRPLLENAHKACRRARDLVARLMSFSRTSPPSGHAVAIGPLIDEVAALVRATLPSNITIQRQLAPGCPPLDGDAAEIHEVLMNLVVNAAAALGDKGGLIEIGLQYGTPAAALRELNPLVRAEPQLQLSVRDNGQGMSAEVRARIFEPFFTTKAPGVGTGIGLTMVHRIITDLGGTIVVDSQPGRGTQMTLFLPAGRAPLPPATPTARPFPLRAQGRILLVDDEPQVLAVAAEALQRIGLTAETYSSAGLALAAFKFDSGSYVALLTDLSMPEMSGVDLAAEIRRLSPHVPVVIMTGHLTETARAKARALGQVQFIQKPFDLPQLQAQFAGLAAEQKAAGSLGPA